MGIFNKTIMFLIFGMIFLVIFGVSVFIVNVNHDFLQPYSIGMDPAFGNLLNTFQSAIMLLGVLLSCWYHQLFC
jgi:hypothetical protein